jgi:hypothetical protein
MRKSLMQKLAIACVAAFAVLGGVGAANAQMHGGGGGSHGGGGFHGGGFHGGGFHGGGFHGGGFHGGGFHNHSHGSFFIGAPIIYGPGYYPYGYSYPYGDSYPYGYVYPYAPQDSGSFDWYCRNPAGYYPDVQTCPSGWLQVVPNN